MHGACCHQFLAAGALVGLLHNPKLEIEDAARLLRCALLYQRIACWPVAGALMRAGWCAFCMHSGGACILPTHCNMICCASKHCLIRSAQGADY